MGHPRRRRHLVERAVVDRRREVEVLAAFTGDPDVGGAVIDQVRCVLHEPEVEADLDEHHHHADGDARRGDRELDAVVKENLASQGPHAPR